MPTFLYHGRVLLALIPCWLIFLSMSGRLCVISALTLPMMFKTMMLTLLFRLGCWEHSAYSQRSPPFSTRFVSTIRASFPGFYRGFQRLLPLILTHSLF